MVSYICPVCQKRIDRDLILFTEHTKKHIIDAIKKKHPEWIEKNGACDKCVDFFDEQINGESA